MRVAVVLLVLATALPAKADRPAPSIIEWSALAAAELSLGLDMLQTLDIKRHPGTMRFFEGTGPLMVDQHRELNPILGQHPTDAKIAVYFAAAGALTAGLWYALPRHWRLLVPLVVLAVQIPQIASNARSGVVIRF